MKPLLAVGLLLVVALAGCGGSSQNLYTCKAGKVVDLNTVAGHDAASFQPESACPPVIPPSLIFKVPGNITLYKPVSFLWTALPGNHTGGHTMLTSIRMSHHPIPVDQLTKMDDYGTELVKVAHQDLPHGFIGAAMTFPFAPFTEAGTYYVRAYMTFHADDMPEQDVWGVEQPITIGPVPATGVTVTCEQTLGDYAGTFKCDKAGHLGDALVFKNSDARAHDFTVKTAPSGFIKPQHQSVAANGASTPFLLNVPGSYTFEVDDAQAVDADLNVAAPA